MRPSKCAARARTPAFESRNALMIGPAGMSSRARFASAPRASSRTSADGSLISCCSGPTARESSMLPSAPAAAARTSRSRSSSTAINADTARRLCRLPSDCAAARRTPASLSFNRSISASTTPVSSVRRSLPPIRTPAMRGATFTRPIRTPTTTDGTGATGPPIAEERGGRAGGGASTPSCTPGAAATIALNMTIAAPANANFGAGDVGVFASINRAIRATSNDRCSAIPATGTPSGDAWIHSATRARHLASGTPLPVRAAAQSSHRYSATCWNSRRARRLSGWKKKTRSSRLAASSHSGSRRVRCASSCASSPRCCSASRSVSAASGTQISPTPSATGLEIVLDEVRRTRPRCRTDARNEARISGSDPSVTIRRSPSRPSRIRRRASQASESSSAIAAHAITAIVPAVIAGADDATPPDCVAVSGMVTSASAAARCTVFAASSSTPTGSSPLSATPASATRVAPSVVAAARSGIDSEPAGRRPS